MSMLLSTSIIPVPFANNTRFALLAFVVILFALIVTSSITAVVAFSAVDVILVAPVTTPASTTIVLSKTICCPAKV